MKRKIVVLILTLITCNCLAACSKIEQNETVTNLNKHNKVEETVSETMTIDGNETISIQENQTVTSTQDLTYNSDFRLENFLSESADQNVRLKTLDVSKFVSEHVDNKESYTGNKEILLQKLRHVNKKNSFKFFDQKLPITDKLYMNTSCDLLDGHNDIFVTVSDIDQSVNENNMNRSFLYFYPGSRLKTSIYESFTEDKTDPMYKTAMWRYYPGGDKLTISIFDKDIEINDSVSDIQYILELRSYAPEYYYNAFGLDQMRTGQDLYNFTLTDLHFVFGEPDYAIVCGDIMTPKDMYIELQNDTSEFCLVNSNDYFFVYERDGYTLIVNMSEFMYLDVNLEDVEVFSGMDRVFYVTDELWQKIKDYTILGPNEVYINQYLLKY